MKDILQSLISKMPSVNMRLKDPHLIADLTWLDLTNSTQKQKRLHIFRSLWQEWLLAVNGEVSMGEWDYFPNTHSILIVQGDSSVLYNALLIDNHYLVLKQDAYEEGILLINQAYYLHLLERLGGKEAIRQIVSELKELALSNWPSKPKVAAEAVKKEAGDSPIIQKRAAGEVAEKTIEDASSAGEEPAVEEKRVRIKLSKSKEEKESPKDELPPFSEDEQAEEEATQAAVEGDFHRTTKIMPELSSEEAEVREPQTSEGSILDRYRQEAKVEAEEEEEQQANIHFNLPKQTSLNDRLKAQLNKGDQSTLLDKLKQNK